MDVSVGRPPRYVVTMMLKPEESEWLADEAERLGVSQAMVIRHAILRLRDREPLQLPWDREIVTRRGGVSKAATINPEIASFIKAECWRLFTSQSDFVRHAILQLRKDGPVWIPRPRNRHYWWRGRYRPIAAVDRNEEDRPAGILRRIVRAILS
jgi:hypothetical protein